MCFASSGPGGTNLSLDDCRQSIDRIVGAEGHVEVVQLSGGEPTIHPEFTQILQYAVAQPIDYIQINTNGIRLANDQRLVDEIAQYQDRVEVFFQLDGLDPECTLKLRGEDLLPAKLRAIGCCSDCGPDGGCQPDNKQQQNPYVPMNEKRRDTTPRLSAIAAKFLTAAVSDQLGARDLFRITITSFLDAWNFDLRRLIKCCTHHVLPSGHVIPFCAYNVLYREGHVSLPELTNISSR